MVCCLNPHCSNPVNSDETGPCKSCATPLVAALRGRYRPIRLIGKGGFGRTYLATDCDRLNAPCVIKQFAPQARGTKSFTKAVELFNQEAVRLHDLGEHAQIPALLAYFEQGKYLYLVQQYIEGKTLLQEIQEQGPLDEPLLREVLLDILPVLDFIHWRGVVHRDITPTNLLRRTQDRRLFLIDFGIAKQFGEALSPEPGTRIGTEGYAPIEQLRGGQAYPCSDLYSLGATCLHLLTGRRPDHLYDPLQGQWRWQEALARKDRSVSRELGHLLDRLTRDAVSERFRSAREVMQVLERVPQLRGSVPGWIRKHPTGDLSGTSTVLQSAPAKPLIDLPAFPTAPPSGPANGQSAPKPSPPPPPPPNPLLSGPPSPPPAISMPRSSGPSHWQCARVLTGHQSWVTAVTFNPRMATLASGSLDDRIKVWNLHTGEAIYTLNGHPRGVNDVAVTTDGQTLVSCGDDGTVKSWSLAAGRRKYTLKGHIRDVTGIAIGQKTGILASGSKDKSIHLWKLADGTPIRTLLGSPAAIRAVAITPDETHLISGGLDNKVRLWNIQTGEMMRVFSGHTQPVNRVVVSRDGLFVASASKDKTVRLWSVMTGAVIHCLAGHLEEVRSVAIAPDNRTIISGSIDRTIRIWDAKTGVQLHSLTGHRSGITAIALHRSGRLIASASADKTIRVWKWG